MEYVKTFESFINESSDERIYFNRDISKYFDVPYDNKGKTFLVHTDALMRDPVLKMADGWDEKHQEIFAAHKGDLDLKGDGHGWWKFQK